MIISRSKELSTGLHRISILGSDLKPLFLTPNNCVKKFFSKRAKLNLQEVKTLAPIEHLHD